MVVEHIPPGPPIVAAPAPERTGPAISRRGVLRLAFWSALFASVGGIGATMVNAVYPRKITGFGGPIVVPAARIPAPGDDPVRILAARCWLVNLLPDEGLLASDKESSQGGLVALWQKCPHLGCTVPWKPGFPVQEDPIARDGYFNCNCHGSTYTKAGTLIRDPATRSMDTMEIEVGAGGIVIQTGKIAHGKKDNPRRAVPYTDAT
jgi:cytochrome b6-f complex iron-sulfur subunit